MRRPCERTIARELLAEPAAAAACCGVSTRAHARRPSRAPGSAIRLSASGRELGRRPSPERPDALDEELEEGIGVDRDADVHVRRAVRPIPQVDDSAAAAQLGLELDLDAAMSRLDESRADQVRDRDGVVDRRPVPAVRLAVVAREVDVQVGDERPDATGRREVGASTSAPRSA